jgi:hypothetical protein
MANPTAPKFQLTLEQELAAAEIFRELADAHNAALQDEVTIQDLESRLASLRARHDRDVVRLRDSRVALAKFLEQLHLDYEPPLLDEAISARSLNGPPTAIPDITQEQEGRYRS